MLQRWFRTKTPPAISRYKPPPAVCPDVPKWREAALALPDGTLLGEILAKQLHAEMASRAEAVCPGWSLPRLSELRIRRKNLPDRWCANRNLLLEGPDATFHNVSTGMDRMDPFDCVAVLGAGVRAHDLHIGGRNSLIAIGDRCRLHLTPVGAFGGGTVLIGEETSSTFLAQVDARNGGSVLIGADGMWAAGVRIITDDMHAIRDLASGARLNERGGRIIIEPHVWLGEQVVVMNSSRIGRDSTIGMSTLVKGIAVPAHSVCAGRPVRLLRTGTTWCREDMP